MKIFKALAILGTVAAAVGCGSNNNSGGVTQSGLVQPTPCGVNGVICPTSGALGQLPIYGLGNQIIGYKTVTPLLVGAIPNALNLSYSVSTTVNVGDSIVVNMQGASANATVTCQSQILGGIVNVYSTKNKSEALPAPSVTLNGSALGGSGFMIAQTAGTVTISGSYPSLSDSCSSGTATVQGYYINFGNSGVYTAHCTTTAGGAMTCPTN